MQLSICVTPFLCDDRPAHSLAKCRVLPHNVYMYTTKGVNE